MGLMDDIMSERKTGPRRCPVHLTLELIGGADAEELRKVIEDNLVPAPVITRVLARRNLTLKSPGINKHRRGECGCAK